MFFHSSLSLHASLGQHTGGSYRIAVVTSPEFNLQCHAIPLVRLRLAHGYGIELMDPTQRWARTKKPSVSPCFD